LIDRRFSSIRLADTDTVATIRKTKEVEEKLSGRRNSLLSCYVPFCSALDLHSQSADPEFESPASDDERQPRRARLFLHIIKETYNSRTKKKRVKIRPI
jgi:hypothetical protein